MCVIYAWHYKLISQGICGNPWPMLNTAVESLGYYKDTLTEECLFENYLFEVDPEDCSKFYSCIEGNITMLDVSIKNRKVTQK